MPEPRIGVVGATGAVGHVTLELLAERGFGQVRAFASERSAGSSVPYADGELVVEEASADTLRDLDLCFFSVGTAQSAELVPPAVRAGAVCVDKSSAFRLTEGIPLVVPEVNGDRAAEHDGIVANPNCSTIQLVCALKPLHEAAGLRSVRIATYQAASGAGVDRMEELRAQEPAAGNVSMDWEFDGDESDEGVQAPRRDAQDPGAAGLAPERDLRTRAGAGRPLAGRLDRDRASAVTGRGP
jgi:aspartate-semialdehyde dehydrogenase